jgi:hypothetical protein
MSIFSRFARLAAAERPDVVIDELVERAIAAPLASPM